MSDLPGVPSAPPPGGSVAVAAPGAARPAQGQYRASFVHVVRAEWIKLRSLRSTVITSSVAAVLAIGIGALVSLANADHPSTPPTDPTMISLVGITLAQLVVIILGVMTVTSEYSSRTIMVSLMAAPRRGRFLLAKILVIAVVCFVLGEVVSFASFGVGQAIMHGSVASASLTQPQVTRAVIGGGLYLTATGLMGAGLGFLLRSTAAGIVVGVAVIFVVPIIAAVVSGHIGTDISKFWPTDGGAQIFRVRHGTNSSIMSPWNGFFDLVAFVVILLVAGYAVLTRRDA